MRMMTWMTWTTWTCVYIAVPLLMTWAAAAAAKQQQQWIECCPSADPCVAAQDDGVQKAKVAAQRALLSTIPDHVMRELEKHAEEAKAEAEKLKVMVYQQPKPRQWSMRVTCAGCSRQRMCLRYMRQHII